MKNLELEISLIDQTPVALKPYSVPLSLQETLKNELIELQRNNIIQKSHSRYEAPVFLLVKKETQKIRLIVDYRGLIQKVIKEAFPFPTIHQSLTKISGCNRFSSLDLHKGYTNFQ